MDQLSPKAKISGVISPKHPVSFASLIVIILALALFAMPLFALGATPQQGDETISDNGTIPPAPVVELTVTTNGSGTVAPASGSYPVGTIVELTPLADLGWLFQAWSGACSGNQRPCLITMDESKSIMATFVLTPEDVPEPDDVPETAEPLGRYRIATEISGTGSGRIILEPSAGSYPIGTTVSATAVAETGSTFVGWGGDCIGLQLCMVTIERAHTVEAIFRAVGDVPTAHPKAVDDDGSTAQGQPVVIDLVANDRPANIDEERYEDARAGLTIGAVGQPTSNGAPISGIVTLQGTQATFQPGPDFIGTAHFTYLLSDRQADEESSIDIGKVTVTVVSEMAIIPVQSGERATYSFDATIATDTRVGSDYGEQPGHSQSHVLETLVDIPTGAMLNYPGAPQRMELSFGWINHSTLSEQQRRTLPPGTVREPIHFVIDATVDNLLIQEYAFGNPIKVAIAYPEALFGNMAESELAVRYWDTRVELWQNDGVHIIQHDRAQNLAVVEIGHLTQFALFTQETTPSFGEDGRAPVSRRPTLYLPFR